MPEAKSATPELPKAPIDRLAEPMLRFLHIEAASGVVLLACTVVALALANSPVAETYLGFWSTKVGFTFGEFEFRHSLKHLINDGLMAVFFFVIGLEVKRELVLGELKEVRRAVLPIAAALGGMAAPALIYLACLRGAEGQRGWGIPMATDIAFVVGCLALLGSRVPRGLRVMMLSLAIVDDLGAILVIAIGYTEDLSVTWLLWGFAGLGLIVVLSWSGVGRIRVYFAVGVCVWFAFHESGVHATIAGVILGLLTPSRERVNEGLFGEVLRSVSEVFEGGRFSDLSHRAEKVQQFRRITRETISPLEYLEAKLHPWTSFVIMPIFALANAGVAIHLSELGAPVAIAVVLGLVVGKPVGVVAFSWIAVASGVARLPEGVGWGAILAGGCLAGIGFTMALFIAGLALSDALLDTAKIGVLAGSGLAAATGMVLLSVTLPKEVKETPRDAD